MQSLYSSPLFGILLSIIAFEIGVFINRRTKISLLNPMLIGIILIILFLLLFNIDYASYKVGGDYISFFLAPATVSLAVPLYKQLNKLKANLFPILAGITLGSVTCLISVILLSRLFSISKDIALSMFPKSITIPMATEVAKSMGGNPSITIACVMITGITGAIAASFICKICRIKDPVAKGVATGTASHAVGTSRMMEEGETEGAMSSLSIGIAGVVTAIASPVLIPLFF